MFKKLRRPLQALLLDSDEEVWNAVLTGERKITIRKGHRNYAPGSSILCCPYKGVSVACDIISVRHCKASKVRKEEYTANGYENIKHMLKDLRIYYPSLAFESPVTVIGWDNVRGKLVDAFYKNEKSS